MAIIIIRTTMAIRATIKAITTTTRAKTTIIKDKTKVTTAIKVTIRVVVVNKETRMESKGTNRNKEVAKWAL